MPPQPNLKLAILALGLGSFAIGTSEFAAMGLLPWYASDLAITEPQAGHVISAYALGVVVGAPITSIIGARLPRRRYLAALIAVYGVMNLLAAVLPGYGTLVFTRFLAGLPHGGYLGVAMLFAADALPKEQRAKGVTQVLLGLTIANIAGVPLAGVLGQGMGWRWGFALPGVLALIAGWLILRLAPRVGANAKANPMAELKALKNPAVMLTLAVGAVGCGGVFAVYSYLSAAMLATTNPPSWAVAALLSAFGVGMTLGSIIAAKLTIRLGEFKAAFVLMVFMALTQGLASLAVGNWILMIASSFIVGVGASMAVPLQTRLMEVAGEAQSMAAAMNHAAFNAANALGPWLAGMALAAGWGWSSSGLVGVGLSLAGMVMLAIAWWQARASGQAFEDYPARA
ncbi:MFS transporter [Paracoccus ravus]|uniref:MFS transporter n=1 Tax=Paracoccus ravus TaxID=2447760 RepID=UPI00106E4FC5|nr:MFS transporter [Paracoccus ravus]